ncbi:hypothetical protein F8B43_2762 [Methylorubrum populi]|uniref:Uncharacterized protein n=1 Tax=Methylorubrum populi TaxID=223967 RepID=A0A833J5R6_9HYPH|nr:hypothetical protein F8B43_2762 [Methylorubrum populi]
MNRFLISPLDATQAKEVTLHAEERQPRPSEGRADLSGHMS